MVFCMAEILKTAVDEELCGNLLSEMGAKISRRCFKLAKCGIELPEFAVESIQEALASSNELLADRCKKVPQRKR